jgi:hypothetical protein
MPGTRSPFSLFLLVAGTSPASRSFPAAGSGSGNLGRAHQIANVFLQELVVAIQLVVLLLDGFYTVEQHQKRVLQCLGVSVASRLVSILVVNGALVICELVRRLTGVAPHALRGPCSLGPRSSSAGSWL